jgi:purine-cytosine permease-like protein
MGGLGILLVAIGAILAFAVNVSVSEVDLSAVGWIFMLVGAVAIIAGVVRDAPFFRRRSERYVSADGRHVVDETRSTL